MQDYRPKTFEDYITSSNESAVKILRDAVTASKITKKPLPHILLFGPAGTGKTTLAKICANEIGNCEFIETIGSGYNNQEDIMKNVLKIYGNQLEGKNSILMVDEVHELNSKSCPDTLWYPLLEDYKFYHSIDEGKLVDGIIIEGNVVELKPFTVIGASTDIALLKAPMRDRFPIHATLKAYTAKDLIKVIGYAVKSRNYNITNDAVVGIANRSRGNPRLSVNFLQSCEIKRVVKKEKKITKAVALALFDDIKVDGLGLTENDLLILKVLKEHNKGCGVGTLAGITNIDKKTLGEIYLAYLQRIGLTTVTHRQFITKKGADYVKRV